MAWVAAVMQAIGMYSEAEAGATESAAKHNEALDNQRLADSAAFDAERRGVAEAGKARTKGSELIASQNVAYANSGVDPTVGTPASVMADTRVMSELDAQTLKNNAAREAWGFRKYGIKYGQQAALESTRGANRQTATFLTGTGRVASSLSSSLSDYKE